MADDKITSVIKCQNIAPIVNLTREIKSSSLKMGVFANNGSGKTFLSRLFRLTEKQDELVLDENGKSPTDKLLTFGKNSGTFSFVYQSWQRHTLLQFLIAALAGANCKCVWLLALAFRSKVITPTDLPINEDLIGLPFFSPLSSLAEYTIP